MAAECAKFFAVAFSFNAFKKAVAAPQPPACWAPPTVPRSKRSLRVLRQVPLVTAAPQFTHVRAIDHSDFVNHAPN